MAATRREYQTTKLRTFKTKEQSKIFEQKSKHFYERVTKQNRSHRVYDNLNIRELFIILVSKLCMGVKFGLSSKWKTLEVFMNRVLRRIVGPRKL
jgi:hypothetical protein